MVLSEPTDQANVRNKVQVDISPRIMYFKYLFVYLQEKKTL